MLFQPKYALLQMEVISFSHTSVAPQHLDTLSIHLWNSLLFGGGLLALSLSLYLSSQYLLLVSGSFHRKPYSPKGTENPSFCSGG